MAYSDIGDVTAGDPVTETYLDQIRANFQASAPDAFTAQGDIFAATGADAGARLAIGANDSTLVADSSESTGLAWQIQPAARVYNDADITLSSGSWVAITHNSENYDTDALHSTSSNTQRLTIPSGGDGLYHIGGVVRFGTGIEENNSSLYALRILLNGTTIIAMTQQKTYRAETHDLVMSISTDYALSATDYVELQAYTNQSIDAEAVSSYAPVFWAHWFRRA